LIDELEQRKEPIFVPTVAVAELLVKIPAKDHDQFVIEMQRRFFCPPVDIKASVIAARLWQAHRELPKAEQLSRSVLKADVLIIASAAAAGASTYYSHEPGARKLADQARLTASDLPLRHPDMFVDAEIRREVGLPVTDEE
jgi:predicted nucleic acid-binding protein